MISPKRIYSGIKVGCTLIPYEILYEAEEPLIFTVLNREDNQKYIAYHCWLNNNLQNTYYLIAKTSDSIIEQLKQSTITIRQALHNELQVVNVSFSGEIIKITSTSLDQISSDYLPTVNCKLYQDL